MPNIYRSKLVCTRSDRPMHSVPRSTMKYRWKPRGLSSGTFPPRMWQASAALKFCRLPFGLAVAKSMLSGVREVLCATRRSRLLLGVAIAVFPLMVILILLEISYKNEVAREDSSAVTHSLAGSPAVDPAELKFEAEPPQLQLGRPIVPFGPPIQPAAADASPPEPPQKPPQSSVVARKPVPLPRSRPNRF